jgi:hypothetical protein
MLDRQAKARNPNAPRTHSPTKPMAIRFTSAPKAKRDDHRARNSLHRAAHYCSLNRAIEILV